MADVPPADAFCLPLDVQPADIDENGHVNNVVYLRWCQEAAGAHWAARADADWLRDWGWLVLRHEIDYRRGALPDAQLEAATWVGGHRGARFDRHVQIRDARSGDVHADALTTWAMVDRTSLRPLRIPREVIARFAPAAGA